MAALVLLAVNSSNQSVSQITGQARSLFAILNVVLLASIAEELVFRGVMWSIFTKLFSDGRSKVIPLLGTSLLFGIEHLAYWGQSYSPIPPEAYLHAFLMMTAGICFGAFRWASGSLVVPIILHIIANGIILVYQ